MISIVELKKEIENLGYIATEELIYDTFNALCMFNDGEIKQRLATPKRNLDEIGSGVFNARMDITNSLKIFN